MPWTAADLPDLTGRVAIVTGASSGIGEVTARELARASAHVILACRDAARGDAARERIRAAVPEARAEVMLVDVSRLASVRAFAKAFLARGQPLDLLVNNAGVMALPYASTEDGFERQMATNHFGPFLLTARLLPALLAAGGERPARIVTVSSMMHRRANLDFEDLDGKIRYQPWVQYGRTKLANLLFTYELDRRVRALGHPLLSVAAHPGYAATNLQFVGPTMTGSTFTLWTRQIGGAWLAQSPEMGALPTLYAATAPGVEGGDYHGPGGLFEIWGHPRKVSSNAASHDEAAARRLWEISEARTGERLL